MMGSVFAAEVIEATAACDAVMAELFLFQPMTQITTTSPSSPDLGRATLVVMATYRDQDAKPTLPNGYDSRSQDRPGIQSSHPRIQVSPAQLAALPTPLVVKSSDLWTRQSDGRTWRVTSVSVTGGGILKCLVNLSG